MAQKKKVAKRKEGIHIQRSSKDKKFFVDEVASNGNILQHSEGVNRKQSAFKNILAMGKLFADVMSGKTGVTDEKGETWVLQKDGKFKNTTSYIRQKIGKSLVALAKEASKKSGKAIVIKGPRGGTMLDTRKKKSAKKK